MHPPPTSRTRPYNLPVSSSSSSLLRNNVPLTAERAMIDQIRSKLERAQRRLARHGPSSCSSSIASSSSTCMPSSLSSVEYTKPLVASVLVEDIPAIMASKGYVSSSSSSSSRVTRSTMTQLPTSLPKLSRSSHDRPSRSSLKTYDSIQSSYKYIQYKSKSKYSQETDPLNGGPPPMSTPYLVYSNSRLPMTRSNETTKTNHGRDKQDDDEKPLSSAMRSGLARPPSSRVRFQGHETLSREKSERDYQEMERTQCQEQGKEREARRHREKDLQHGKASGRPNGSEPLSSIATILRGRRSASIENPPKSAIKLSAYDKMMQTIPTSPVGRSRRSSIGNLPPKSDIKISAFDDVNARRRSLQDKQLNPTESIQPKDEAVEVVASHTTDHRRKVVEQVRIELTSDTKVAKASLPSVVPEPEAPHSAFDVDDEDTSTNETDDSYDYEFSDFDTDSEDTPSRCLVSEANAGKVDADPGFVENNAADSSRQVGEDKGTSSCSATELPIVKEGKEGERHRVSKLTARDLALHALGRASTCSISDVGSPVSSANERDVLNDRLTATDTTAAPTNTPPPMLYTPASSAYPSSRALGRRAPATTGRVRNNRMPPPPVATSSYVRRSRARAPMDLKNHLPPSIGVLSDLSSGSSTFVINPSHFYEVTWRSGEFAFSVQRVYTEENEYEFDDCNQESQLFLRMLLNTERSTCKSFGNVRVGDVLIRVGDTYVSELGLEGSGTVLTKFFANLVGQTPIRLTFQRMSPSDWEGGVEL